MAVDLRALHLGVPVRALHEAHVPAPPRRLRLRGQPVDDRQRPLLVRLHRKAEAVPAVQARMHEDRPHHLERELQPVGLFRVDRHRDADLLRQLREREHLGDELVEHALALRDLVARVQRGQLHRDRRRRHQLGEWPARADRPDRVLVGLEVALRVGLRERGLAEHVVRITVAPVFLFLRTVERLGDRPPHHELVAHDAHRLAHGQAHHGLAAAPDQALQRAEEVALRLLGQRDQLAGEHQAPGRGVHEQRVALAEVRFPVGVAQLVADQAVGRRGVGDAQQRFRDAHQQHALLGRKVVLAHQALDRRLLAGARADPRHERARMGQDRIALGIGERGLREQLLDHGRLVRGIARRDAAPGLVAGRRQLGREDRRGVRGGRGRGRNGHGAWAGIGAGCEV